MASNSTPLPHWTWEDLEAALDAFSPLGASDPVRSHLLRGLGHGPGRSPERRLGYRPPPRGWGVRLLIIAILVIVFALMVKGIADTILAYTERAGAIGRALDSGAPAERPASPPAPA